MEIEHATLGRRRLSHKYEKKIKELNDNRNKRQPIHIWWEETFKKEIKKLSIKYSRYRNKQEKQLATLYSKTNESLINDIKNLEQNKAEIEKLKYELKQANRLTLSRCTVRAKLMTPIPGEMITTAHLLKEKQN